MLSIKTPEEAETVFYEAFRLGDIDVMSALWAGEEAVCVHPGSGIISGREAVIRSWQHILGNGAYGELNYRVTRKSLSGDLAVHLVVEEMMENGSIMAVVIATNVYQRFDQGWLITGHHGSLMQNQHHGQTLQ